MSVIQGDNRHINAAPPVGKSRPGCARRTLCAVGAVWLCMWAWGSSAQLEAGTADVPVLPADFVSVTDDDAHSGAGCDAITVADSSSGAVVTRGLQRVSPGQITANRDGSLIASLATNSGVFVGILAWQPASESWESAFFRDPVNLRRGGDIAISPDDSVMLVAWSESRIAKYSLATVTLQGLGPVVATATMRNTAGHSRPTVASAITYAADSRTAHVVGNDGLVYTLDVESMRWLGAPIEYDRVPPAEKEGRSRRTFATLSPDEQWLVVSTGSGSDGALSVVDLRSRDVDLHWPPGLQRSQGVWGVAFNYAVPNRGLLAVHGGATSQSSGGAPLGSTPLPPAQCHLSD